MYVATAAAINGLDAATGDAKAAAREPETAAIAGKPAKPPPPTWSERVELDITAMTRWSPGSAVILIFRRLMYSANLGKDES